MRIHQVKGRLVNSYIVEQDADLCVVDVAWRGEKYVLGHVREVLGRDPADIVVEKGLTQITDTGAIEAAIDQVIAANPDKAAEVKAGKDKLLGWFVGQVMKGTGGKANPAMLNDLLRKKLLG